MAEFGARKRDDGGCLSGNTIGYFLKVILDILVLLSAEFVMQYFYTGQTNGKK